MLALVGWLCLAAPVPGATLSFADGTLAGWTASADVWTIAESPELFCHPGEPPRFVVDSLTRGEAVTGTLRSPVFTITSPRQAFSVSGWDGTLSGQNNGDRNWVLLRAHPDGQVLRRAHTPGQNRLVPVRWTTFDLIGREVYVEVVDDNPVIRPGGFAWIAFADYRQETVAIDDGVEVTDLHGLRLDDAAVPELCGSLPFLAAPPGARGASRRRSEPPLEFIPLGGPAEAVYLLGLVNWGWDHGTAHWGEHPELRAVRDDQLYVGCRIGELEVRYADGASDLVPLELGATVWFGEHFIGGAPGGKAVDEPFASRPDLRAVLERCLRLVRDPLARADSPQTVYALALRPRQKPIRGLLVRDNPAFRGTPLITAVTVRTSQPTAEMAPFPAMSVSQRELEPRIDLAEPLDWSADLEALAAALYTGEEDLPEQPEPLAFRDGFAAAAVRFRGDRFATMLNNLWVANLEQIAGKFAAEDGCFHETGRDTPWYGGYSGVGTWAPEVGVYYDGAFGRCSDHFATLALRCLDEPARLTSYVDFCDYWLYWRRADHDPANGPPNEGFDAAGYPPDAPSHWAFVMQGGGPPWPINEIAGDEETDGHGATMVGRWVAWRMAGAPRGEWLTAPREGVFGRSRWDSTREAAEFVCWLLDYTGRDVVYCEGETTGWAGGPHLPLAAPGWSAVTDPVRRREIYAGADMYEVYPSHACLTGLRCSAQMADAAGEPALAARWRAYAERIQTGMLRELRDGDHNAPAWNVAYQSVYPSLQDCLVQAWFAQYLDGYDPTRWQPEMARTTRHTYARQRIQQPGLVPVLGFGYGIGWLAQSALMLDELDDAGELLRNIARYSYDKNMDYADAERGIDWRRWLWIIPEGTNLLPTGRWHRIGDLSNGANQGPPLHAIEICAGVDDTQPAALKLLPRVPPGFEGLEVERFPALVPSGDGLVTARINYAFTAPEQFDLVSDRDLPTLAVRLGPHASRDAAEQSARRLSFGLQPGARWRVQQSGRAAEGEAWWVWIEGLSHVTTLSLRGR